MSKRPAKTSPQKTPVPFKHPGLYHVRAATPAEVSAVIGVNEKTIRRWCAPEVAFPCPHDRKEDGRLYLSADEVREWMKITGTTGEPGRPDGTRADVGFWRLHVIYSTDPKQLAADFERDVLAGTRTLSPDEVREYVENSVAMRQTIGDAIRYVAPWVTGLGDEKEVERRIRAGVFGRFDWFIDRVTRMHDAQDGAERDENTDELLSIDGKPVKQTAGRPGKETP